MPEPADTLFSEVACLSDCAWRPSMAQSLRIAFIRRAVLAANPAADVSRAALEASAACFYCLGITGADGLELALLSLLSDALA